jgi:AcrR family transcriptional regulator
MPKIVDHDRYRKELLLQCLTLFAARGYGSITMRQIAKELGVSTGTLYHYFPGKEDIFIQLVQEVFEQDIANFLVQAPEGGSSQKRLRNVMEFFLKNFQFYQQQLLLWVEFHQQSRNQAEAQQFLQGFWQRTRDQLATYLKDLESAQVDFVLIFLDGLLLQVLYGHADSNPGWIDTQTELLVKLLASGSPEDSVNKGQL